MLIAETIGRIRREHYVQGKTIRGIARDLKLSRNTVRKVLRSAETAFSMGDRFSRGRSRGDGQKTSIGCWRGTRTRRGASG
jgi:predicted transcriptional regulator